MKINNFKRTAIFCTEHTPANYILTFIWENFGRRVVVEYETYTSKFGGVQVRSMVLTTENVNWIKQYMGEPTEYIKNPYARVKKIALAKDSIITSAEA
jgi:hypothetical protein